MQRVLLYLLLITACSSTHAQPDPVRVGMMPFAGYAEMGAAGQATGAGVDIVVRLLEEAGYDYEVRLLPPARVLGGLADGSVEIWPGMLNKPFLEEHTLVTRGDLGLIEIALLRRPETPAVDWPAGLEGKSLITITNYTYTEPLLNALAGVDGLLRHHSNSHAGALEMLLRGRGDYLLQYVAQVGPLLQARGMPMLPLQIVSSERMRLLISRHSPRAEQLRDDLDAAWVRLHQRGESLDLRYRWEDLVE